MNFSEQHSRYLELCQAAVQMACENLFQPAGLSKVSEAAAYSLLNGGKRVRGVLTLAVCDMLGGDLRIAAEFAAAVEMVHAYSLVHDDLPCMDDSPLRRGKPSTHIAFGETTALLAGDLLLTQAFECLAQAGASPENAIKAVGCLAKAAGAKGMVYGQELDLKHEMLPASIQDLYQIHRNKTGALLSAAAVLGILAAGKSELSEYTVVEYADRLGLVFQIVDDVLDVTSDEASLGKPVGDRKSVV